MKKLICSIFTLFLLNSISYAYTDIQIAKGIIINIEKNEVEINLKKGICKGIRHLKINDKNNLNLNVHQSITFIINGECNRIIKILNIEEE